VTTVSLASLNAATQADFVAALGDIYEHAPWVAEAAASRRPFETLAALHDAMSEAVRSAPADQGLALINGHPDLAGKAARAGAMTTDSKAEQASVGLDRLSEAEFAQFHRLNDAYKAKFGIPFIVCVRRHTKDSILRQFEQRLRNDATAELDAALGEISRITALRLDQRVEAPDRLKVNGRISTHILDTRWALVITYIAFGLPLTVFFMAGYFKTFSREVIEAAIVDGANIYQVFYKVALPMVMNAIVTVALVQFFFMWNDLLVSLTFVNNPDLRTVQSGLLNFAGQYGH